MSAILKCSYNNLMGMVQSQLRRGLLDHGRFFLHVGGNQWYKNRLGVVGIFQRLAVWSGFEGHHLMMVGKSWTQDMRKLVQQSGLAERIHELTDVANEDLVAFYSLADALIFPSLQEGFGWPVIEAQACGCPVVTSNRSPMTEVAGGAAIYIDPADELGAATRIREGLISAVKLRAQGLKNAARYSKAPMTGGYIEGASKNRGHGTIPDLNFLAKAP